MNRSHSLSSATLAITVLASLLASTSAIAAEADAGLLNDRFMVSAGTFLLSSRTRVSVNGSGNTTGTEVDLKRDLGLQDADRFRVDATWRFAERHKVRALYFNTSKSVTRSLSRSITVGDTVYPVNASVTTEHSTSIFEIAYEYAFMRRENFELTGSVGVHQVKFDFALSGNGSVGSQSAQFRTETAAANAPLPVLGIRELWQFSPKWYLDAQAQYFAMNINGYDGSVTDLRVGVTRMFGQHFGVGAGWNQFVTSIGVDKARFDGEIKWRYSGALIFLTASF
jgi:hypothetical protein